MTIDEITELLREYEELKKTVHRTGLISDNEARLEARARLCTPGNIETLLDALKVDVKRVFTRKDVASAIEQADTCHVVDMAGHFGGREWQDRVPKHVYDAFHKNFYALRVALQEWRDSLPAEAAAEQPPARTARWDAELRAYRLTPHWNTTYDSVPVLSSRERVVALGYTIVEEAEPVVVQGDDFEAWWQPGTKEINFQLRGSEDEPMPVPLELVRDILGKMGTDA